MCVNERGRGGRILPRELDGGETDGGAQCFVEDGSLGRPRSNRGYWEMRQGVVRALVCSGRQGGGWARRNLLGTVVGAVTVRGELVAAWRQREGGA